VIVVEFSKVLLRDADSILPEHIRILFPNLYVAT